MLTEAIVQTSTPKVLKINDLANDETLILKSISNLSSVKVTQFIGDFARAGSYYQGRRPEKRNPVFNFKLNPNYQQDISVSDLREMLFRMFMEPHRDSDQVKVLLKDDKKPDRYFIGYAETVDTDSFTQDQTCSVSLVTTDAYLRSDALTSASNELGWFKSPLVYEGSADTGLLMTFKVLYETPRITVRNGPTGSTAPGPDIMTFDRLFLPGDELVVNTSDGERSILLNGEDMMSTLTADSQWMQLKEQGNVLQIYGDSMGDGKVVMTSYLYRAAWWGI